MKKRSKYVLVLVSFLIIMSLVIFFFMNKYKNINIKNKAINLLEKVYKLEKGEYEYKDGVIYNDTNSYVSDSYDIKGKGKINIDKYGNVKFYINSDSICIYKNSLGNIEISNNNCNSFNDIDIQMINNNNKVSFITNRNNLEYMISTKDDFKGKWIKNNESTVVLNSYNEGNNYIWFKDKNGILSDVFKFNIECLQTKNTKYDKNVFYCTNSEVIIDNINWIVIKDDSNEITLMKKDSLKDKYTHCMKEDNECLFINYDEKYNIENSYIINHLNSVYINDLSKETISSIVEEEICIDNKNLCDDEMCIGYTKEEIEKNNYICDKYTKTKIRLITYDEYNYIRSKVEASSIGNNFYILNSFIENKASIIDNNYDVYINEDFNSPHYIKPVITISKK